MFTVAQNLNIDNTRREGSVWSRHRTLRTAVTALDALQARCARENGAGHRYDAGIFRDGVPVDGESIADVRRAR